jgi:hypothetical protein
MYSLARELLTHNYNNKYTMALLQSTIVYGNLTLSPPVPGGNALITTSNVWAGNILTVNGIFWANGMNYSTIVPSANLALTTQITNVSSSTTYYPTLSLNNASSNNALSAASTLSFVPSTGNLSASGGFSGTLWGQAGITGGNIQGATTINVTTANITAPGFSGTLWGQAGITGGNIQGATAINVTTANITAPGFSGTLWGQAGITGGNIQGATTINITTAITTTANITGNNIVGNLYTYNPGSNTVQFQAGYLLVPQNLQSSGYTLALADAGKHVYITTTTTVTIPANSAVAFPIGTTIALISGAGATTSIAITTDSLYLGGLGTTGTRTLSAYGMASLIKVAATTWFISGTGLT